MAIALTIRPEQLRAISSARMSQFEAEAEQCVRRHWPHAIEGMDEGRLREKIRHILARAQSYGIEEQADLLRYINLSFLLGESFDKDPRYPWAAAFLRAEDLPAPVRLNQLYEWTQTLLERGQLHASGRQ